MCVCVCVTMHFVLHFCCVYIYVAHVGCLSVGGVAVSRPKKKKKKRIRIRRKYQRAVACIDLVNCGAIRTREQVVRVREVTTRHWQPLIFICGLAFVPLRAGQSIYTVYIYKEEPGHPYNRPIQDYCRYIIYIYSINKYIERYIYRAKHELYQCSIQSAVAYTRLYLVCVTIGTIL